MSFDYRIQLLLASVPGGFLASVQQLPVSPSMPYHQDRELPPGQPVNQHHNCMTLGTVEGKATSEKHTKKQICFDLFYHYDRHLLCMHDH